MAVSDILEARCEYYRGSWLVKGDAIITVDLRKATMKGRDEKTKSATIILPQPQVMQPRVDHERTLTWSVERTSWIPFLGNEGPLRDQAMAEAQKLVEHAVKLPEYLGRAKENTDLIISNMFKMVDWDIKVQWEDEPTPADAAKSEQASTEG